MDARAKQFAEEIADKADECCERHGEWAKSIYHFALERLLAYGAERVAAKIRALAPPDARASGASAQESKDFPP